MKKDLTHSLLIFVRPLLPTQLTRIRNVELTNLSAQYVHTHVIHKSSCILNYYQCGLQDTKQDIKAKLLGQILEERFFTQLRTKVNGRILYLWFEL